VESQLFRTEFKQANPGFMELSVAKMHQQTILRSFSVASANMHEYKPISRENTPRLHLNLKFQNPIEERK